MTFDEGRMVKDWILITFIMFNTAAAALYCVCLAVSGWILSKPDPKNLKLLIK